MENWCFPQAAAHPALRGLVQGTAERSIHCCGTDRYSSQFEHNYFTEMCSGSEAGLVFKAHRLCVSLNSRLESNKDEEVSMYKYSVEGHLINRRLNRGFRLLHILLCEVLDSFRAKREQIERFQGVLPEIWDQILVLTVVYVPCSLDSGLRSP